MTPLLFLILGTALRCLLPIEFLHFTNVVRLEGLVAGLFRALRAPLGQLPLQVWEVLLLVWAAGSLGLAARTGFGAWKFHKKLRSYEPLEDSRIEHLAQQAARELDTPAPLLIQTLRADTPVIAGLLRPVILLPCYHYTDEEYRYVFLHELCQLEKPRHVGEAVCGSFLHFVLVEPPGVPVEKRPGPGPGAEVRRRGAQARWVQAALELPGGAGQDAGEQPQAEE